MIIISVGIVVAIIQIFFSYIAMMVLLILLVLADFYFLICIYSLYDKFRNEKLQIIVPAQAQPYNYPQTTAIVYTQQHQQPEVIPEKY